MEEEALGSSEAAPKQLQQERGAGACKARELGG